MAIRISTSTSSKTIANLEKLKNGEWKVPVNPAKKLRYTSHETKVSQAIIQIQSTLRTRDL